MRRLLSLLALCTCTFFVSQASAQFVDVVLENPAYDETTGTLTVDLINRSGQSLNGWVYEVIAVHQSGTQSRLVYTADYAGSDVLANLGVRVKHASPNVSLDPGERRTLTESVNRSGGRANPDPVISATPRLLAVTFADSTARGSAESLAHVKRLRSSRLGSLEATIRSLEAGRGAKDHEALSKILLAEAARHPSASQDILKWESYIRTVGGPRSDTLHQIIEILKAQQESLAKELRSIP